MEKSIYERFIDKTLEVFFSRDKTKLFLLILLVVGFILRLVAAINIGMGADDTVFAVHAINFLGSGKLEVYDQSTSNWYSITDFFYGIFGMGQIGSRAASLLFGTFSILLVFLIAKEFFCKRAGIIAAILLTFSPFHVKNTLAEMDVTVLFFILFSIYFLIAGLKNKGNKDYRKNLILSAVFMGIALMTKSYAILFIPPYLLFVYSYHRKEGFKSFAKIAGLCILVMLVFVLPALTFNYYLYNEKRIMDFQFSRVVGKHLGNFDTQTAEQLYGWNAGWTAKADIKGFFIGNSKQLPWSKAPTSLYSLQFLIYNDPVIFLFGVIGLITMFLMRKKDKRHDKFLIFAILFFVIPYIYIASIILLAKHYVMFTVFLIFPACFSIESIMKKYKISGKLIFIVFVMFSMVYIGYGKFSPNFFYSKSAIAQLFDYKKDNIGENALVLADTRIYRGQTTWIFNNRHYIDVSTFTQAQAYLQNSTEKPVLMEVYFVECAIDDCGWGTIKDQPELNQSMEAFVDYFKNNSESTQEIFCLPNAREFYFPLFRAEKETRYRVYKTSAMIQPSILPIADSTHSWFLYPVGYNEAAGGIFDKYQIDTPIASLLNSVSRAIIYLTLIFSFISIFLALYMVIMQEEDEDHGENKTISIDTGLQREENNKRDIEKSGESRSEHATEQTDENRKGDSVS